MVLFGERKTGFGIVIKKVRDAGFLQGAGECGIRTTRPDSHSVYPTKQGPTQ